MIVAQQLLSTVMSVTREKSRALHALGITERMDDYEKRKLKIFNQLNILQVFTSCLLPVSGIFQSAWFSPAESAELVLPPFISIVVLYLNSIRKFEMAQLLYFFLYPVITSLLYLNGMNLGLELHFILYGILSVFFVSRIGFMVFSLSLSMVSYFVLVVLTQNYNIQLRISNNDLYLVNEIMAILLIFYALYLIKTENAGYQLNLLAKSQILQRKKIEIFRKNKEIALKARQLEKQTAELQELNGIKDKFFSVIAHDLRSPIYALRNMFRQVIERNIPAREIKKLLPEVLADLNNTADLMDNLLHWAKSQIRSEKFTPKLLDITQMVESITRLNRLQAESKKINLELKILNPVYAMGDRDMINLVLRNLVSNAIKFTPPHGSVVIRTREETDHVLIAVQDTGTGISYEMLKKINNNQYFSTNGTANEPGTGLGLMLCRECIEKNGGLLNIESLPGKGSTFSFSLPRGI